MSKANAEVEVVIMNMTKREWFAGMALAGLCQGYHDNEVIADTIAANAFNIADWMMEEGVK